MGKKWSKKARASPKATTKLAVAASKPLGSTPSQSLPLSMPSMILEALKSGNSFKEAYLAFLNEASPTFESSAPMVQA